MCNKCYKMSKPTFPGNSDICLLHVIPDPLDSFSQGIYGDEHSRVRPESPNLGRCLAPWREVQLGCRFWWQWHIAVDVCWWFVHRMSLVDNSFAVIDGSAGCNGVVSVCKVSLANDVICQLQSARYKYPAKCLWKNRLALRHNAHTANSQWVGSLKTTSLQHDHIWCLYRVPSDLRQPAQVCTVDLEPSGTSRDAESWYFAIGLARRPCVCLRNHLGHDSLRSAKSVCST